MVNTVTFPNGNSYNDGVTAPGNMDNGGHRTNLLPMIGDTITVSAAAVSAESAAGVSAAAAAGSAATATSAVSGALFTSTSTSSVAIGSGTKTFTLAAAINVQIGQWMKFTDQANSANYVYGAVTAWDSGTKIVSIDSTNPGGSGTKTSWFASVAGSPGAQGATGAGSGDLLASNNLSELSASAATARANIGAQAEQSDYSRTGTAETRTAAMTFAGIEIITPKIRGATETGVDKGSTGGAVTLDLAAANTFFMVATSNISGITLSNLPASGTAAYATFRIKQDGTGGRTITLGSAYKTSQGVPVALSTAANAVDVITFFTIDGGTTILTQIVPDFR